MGSKKFGTDIPVEPQESFVKSVYSSVDEAAGRRLEQLRIEDGIISTCELGCFHCCKYHILTNIAEAHTLMQYIKRKFSAEQINDLRIRTQQWHEWDNSRPDRYRSAEIDEQTDLSNYDHCCPLLVNGACSAYPVRPIVCRTHFVSSHPLFCSTRNDPESKKEARVVLKSIVTATSALSMAIKDYIENTGLDFSRSIMLLPHWLAIKMDWDFALSL